MVYQKQQAPQLVIPNLALKTYKCEACGMNQPEDLTHSHFMGIYHWNVPKGYQFAQCEETQHFACSNEHALDLAHNCLEVHMPDMSVIPYHGEAEGFLLPPNLPTKCCLAGCGKSLTNDYWQVAPTYAMRGDLALEGHAYWDLPAYAGKQVWFCSLEHAVEGGHILLEQLNDLGYADSEPLPANVSPARRIVPAAG